MALYQHQLGIYNPYFVSTSRDLNVAYGDYVANFRSNRYIYIFAVPKDADIYSTEPVLFYVQFGQNVSHVQFKESELAILYDASPYIVGIYDRADGGRFVDISQI